MRILTDLERTSPPDEAWVREVCKIGQGDACCRFLTVGTKGFTCAKNSRLAAIINQRASKMVAQSDNCEGRISQ